MTSFIGEIEFVEFIGDDGGSVSPTLSALKKAAQSAPNSVAEIPTSAGVTPTYGAANETPPILDGEGQDNYQRHWISGLGKNNGGGGTDNALLSEVAYCHNIENWGFMYGEPGITINFNDGSKADARAAYDGYGSARPYIGIRTNSRYLSVAVQAGSLIRLQVDDAFWPYSDPAPNNNCYVNYDFGSSVSREIVISGQGDGSCFFSDICIETGATIEPYNFFEERGRLGMLAAGDSYQGYNAANIGFMEMTAFQIGCSAVVECGRGSTGYQRNAGNAGWAAVEPERLAFMESNPGQVLLGQLGINDSIPKDALGPDIDSLDAITLTLTDWRASHPSAVMVIQGPWAPNQTNAQQEGSKYRTFMAHILDVMQTLPGDWIVLDNIFGSWTTSKGTTRPTVRGAWQTGTGNVGDPKGDGNGDTWVQADGTHPTVPVGITGLSQIAAEETRMALASM